VSSPYKQTNKQTNKQTHTHTHNFTSVPNTVPFSTIYISLLLRNLEQSWATLIHSQSALVNAVNMCGLKYLRYILAKVENFPWKLRRIFFLFSMARQPIVGQGLLTVETHSDTAYSVGLPWSSDQPETETSNWRHTTLTRDRHPSPRRNSNPQSQQASGHKPTP
jgi:hypothetical protein